MKIHFYGRLADVLGREMEVSIDRPCPVTELRALIAETRPEAAEPLRGKRVRACIGDSVVNEDHIVVPGDTVEFLPPVSGG